MMKFNKILSSAICLMVFSLLGLPLTIGQDAALATDFQGSLDGFAISRYLPINCCVGLEIFFWDGILFIISFPVGSIEL